METQTAEDLLTEDQAADLKDRLTEAYMSCRGLVLDPGDAAWVWLKLQEAQRQDERR